tara:strand:+ start:381 stop:500 length:120 start_codon:yes stop_codon:yes gene_type:complete
MALSEEEIKEIKWYETCEDKTIAMSTARYKYLKEKSKGE